MRVEDLEIDIEVLCQKLGLFDPRYIGNELLFLCPWKRHSSGSYKLYVNKDNGLWECKACGDKRGTLIGLVIEVRECSVDEAKNFLHEEGSVLNPSEIASRLLAEMEDSDKGKVQSKTLAQLRRETKRILRLSECVYNEYWKSRGLRKSDVVEWDLRTISPTPEDGFKYVIPITVKGKPLYYIRRTIHGNVMHKYDLQRGAPRREILFGADKADAPVCVVVEGAIDCIVVWSALRRAKLLDRYAPVALLGSSISMEQAKIIESISDSVVTFLDNPELDSAGRKGISNILERVNSNFSITAANYRVAPKAKDPGDMDHEQIVEAIEKSVPVFLRRRTYGSSSSWKRD